MLFLPVKEGKARKAELGFDRRSFPGGGVSFSRQKAPACVWLWPSIAGAW